MRFDLAALGFGRGGWLGGSEGSVELIAESGGVRVWRRCVGERRRVSGGRYVSGGGV